MSESVTIAINERFDYGSYREFYDQCHKALEQPDLKRLVMDFRRTSYMDSAALGMLVQIQRKAEEKQVEAQIANASGVVMETLTIANMNKLYRFV